MATAKKPARRNPSWPGFEPFPAKNHAAKAVANPNPTSNPPAAPPKEPPQPPNSKNKANPTPKQREPDLLLPLLFYRSAEGMIKARRRGD